MEKFLKRDEVNIYMSHYHMKHQTDISIGYVDMIRYHQKEELAVHGYLTVVQGIKFIESNDKFNQKLH